MLHVCQIFQLRFLQVPQDVELLFLAPGNASLFINFLLAPVQAVAYVYITYLSAFVVSLLCRKFSHFYLGLLGSVLVWVSMMACFFAPNITVVSVLFAMHGNYMFHLANCPFF